VVGAVIGSSCSGGTAWPQAASGTVHLSPAQVSMLLEGIDWRRPQRTHLSGGGVAGNSHGGTLTPRTPRANDHARSALRDEFNEVVKTHVQPIGDADAKEIGLPVTYVAPDDEHWQRYWKLYCLQRIEIGENGKMVESCYVSQVIGE
jgi:hypothetical protein